MKVEFFKQKELNQNYKNSIIEAIYDLINGREYRKILVLLVL